MILCVILAIWVKCSMLTFFLILLITIILLVLTLYDIICVELNGTRIIVLILIILTLTLFLLNTKHINHLHIKGKKFGSPSLKTMAKENSVNNTSKSINIIKVKNTKMIQIESITVSKNKQRTYK